jgi:hypothetical protein
MSDLLAKHIQILNVGGADVDSWIGHLAIVWLAQCRSIEHLDLRGDNDAWSRP